MDINQNDSLGPDSIVKQFSDKRESLNTLNKSIAVFFITLIMTVPLSYGLISLVSLVLKPWTHTPEYVNIIFASGLFFFLFWPIACLVMIAISSLGITLAAIRAIVRGDFISFSHLDMINPVEKIDVISSEEVSMLLGVVPYSVRGLSTLLIADQQADWHSARTSRGWFDILRLKLPYSTAPVVINSLIEGNDIMSDSVKNGITLDINDQIKQYFRIRTVAGAEQEVYELLTPDVLWELLVELDGCDILLMNGYAYFVWPEYLKIRSIFEGRVQTVTKFITSLVHNLHGNSNVKEKLVFKFHKLHFDSLKSIIISAVWMACLMSVAVAVFAIVSGIISRDATYIMGSFLYAVIVFLPGLLVSICVMFSVVLIFVSFRTARFVVSTAISLPKIKKYVTYYEGRE